MRTRVVTGLAIAGLIVACAHLAAPGGKMVPAQIGDGPGWLRGVYGTGIDLDGGHYYAFLWLAFLAYITLVWQARSMRSGLVWGIVGVAVLAFALAPPLLSQDVFSYISYARLGAHHGLNPYDTVPSAVPSDPSFAYVGWRDTASAYGPGFTLASYPLGLTSVAFAFWTFKAVAAICVLALAALCSRLAAARGVNPRAAAAFVALNPLVLVHVVGGAHNDALMMLLVMAGVAALLAERASAAGAGLLGGVAVKVSAAFTAPFGLVGAATASPPGSGRKRIAGLVAGAALALLVIGTATLIAFGAHAFDSLGLVGENQAHTSRYSVPATLSRAGGIDVGVLRATFLVAYGALVVWLLVWTARGGDWVRAAGWAAFGLLIATGWLLPWYVIWVLPLAAVSRDRALTGSVLALTAFQLINRVPL